MRFRDIIKHKFGGVRHMTLEEFIGHPIEEEFNTLAAPLKELPDQDLSDHLTKSSTNSTSKKDKAEFPRVHRKTTDKVKKNPTEIANNEIKIVNLDNKPYDLDKLRKMLSTRPKVEDIITQNGKMAKSGKLSGSSVWNLGLPAFKGLTVDEETGKFYIVDTCPDAGACIVNCFGRKGSYIQYDNSSEKLSKMLTWLLNDPESFKRKLIRQIGRTREDNEDADLKTVIRWHDVGDFFSEEYLEFAIDVAKRSPDVMFYAYTKSPGAYNSSNLPPNFVMRFSDGGNKASQDGVDMTKARTSRLVTRDVFKDLIGKVKNPYTGRMVDAYADYEHKMDNGKMVMVGLGTKLLKDKESYNVLKQRVADKFDIPLDTIVYLTELAKIPVGTEMKWNVIVLPKDPDDAAIRRDVHGVYLTEH